MKTDLEKAISKLEGHTIFLVKGDKELSSEQKGVAPMLSFLEQGLDLEGYSVADRAVGKAAAMLFLKAKVKAVYSYVMTKNALSILEKHGIETRYERLTDVILNRTETDLCPMEKAVKDIGDDDFEEAYEVIKKRYAELMAK